MSLYIDFGTARFVPLVLESISSKGDRGEGTNSTDRADRHEPKGRGAAANHRCERLGDVSESSNSQGMM